MRLIKIKSLLKQATEKRALLKERIFKGELMLASNRARLAAIDIIITNYNKLFNHQPEEKTN